MSPHHDQPPAMASAGGTAFRWLDAWGPAALVCASLLVLWGPGWITLAREVWSADPYTQGPLAALMALWLFWHKTRQAPARAALLRAHPQVALGLAWLLPALALQALARSQSVLALELLALCPALVGLTILFFGARVARTLWFCYVFILFVIPLPGVLVDALTQPMKIAVSWAVEHVLHAAGYAVARDGVVLLIEQYRLLVADACAGLHSLFTLEALGLLYLNAVRHPSPLRNALMALFIVPVSLMANTLRVLLLALVTVHIGDAAGQGLVHDFSGLLLFGLAFLLIVAADFVARQLAAWSGR